MTADDADTDEYAALDARGPAPGASDDLDYFSTLDAPRWAILLAAVGLACAGGMFVREAFRLISSSLGS